MIIIHLALFHFAFEFSRRCILNVVKKYNLGQNVGDILTKVSKIDFSMECFTADFLPFFTKKRQNLAFG